MKMPVAMEGEYTRFLQETGFENPDPQALLMELASISLEVYLREVVWLTDFLGRLEKTRSAA